MSKLSLLLFLAAGLVKAQFGFGYGIGVKGGFPFTDQLKATSSAGAPSLSSSNNYIVGPVVELRIPLGFAAEVNGLYRRAEYTSTLGGISTNINASAWEIPYMAKWRFPIPLLKPFISGGGAYRTFTDLPSTVNYSHNGWVGAVGLELRIARLRLSAEARYMHWHNIDSPLIKADPNQGEVLFGIMF